MSAVTKPILLDETGKDIKSTLEALNHLISHQNAAIDLLASDKAAELVTNVAEVAQLAKNGELLEVMDYGDEIHPEWVSGTTHYNPAMNLCHESDELLEDGETIHGCFFEWDKTTPTEIPFDAPEAIAYFNGTEAAGDYYITIAKDYGNGWHNGDHIQFTLSEAPANGDQLVIALNTSSDTDPTNGRTWTVYGKGLTTAKQTGTTSKGASGTELGSTSASNIGAANGKINAPQRVVYGYNRWSQSNLRQYLNGTEAAGAWWSPQNAWDRPISNLATIDGFLKGYDPEVYRYFKPIKVVTVACDADGNAEDVTYDRVFLSSLEQMYCTSQFSGEEGAYWEYYKRLLGRTSPAPTGSTYARLKKYSLSDPTAAQTCFRRSAYRAYANYVWSVTSSGYVSNYYGAYGSLRCAPGVFISD